MNRLLLLIALLACGDAAAFRGGALPGPRGGAALQYVDFWSANLYTYYGTANDVLASFVVTTSATATNIYYKPTIVAALNTGTSTFDLTNTSGTALCTVSVDCTTLAAASAVCSGASLTAGSTYQIRSKTFCNTQTNARAQVTVRVTHP